MFFSYNWYINIRTCKLDFLSTMNVEVLQDNEEKVFFIKSQACKDGNLGAIIKERQKKISSQPDPGKHFQERF